MMASFSRCRFVRVLQVAFVSCLRMTDTIVVFSVWASNMLKMRSWMTHAPFVGVWAWFRCDLAFPLWKDWHPLPPPVLVSLARAALPSEEADPALALLCPVRALRIYVDRTRSVRSSEHLFVCHGGQQKGKAVSKRRLAHWIVEASRAPWGWGLTPYGVLPPPMRWCTAPLWQTSAELRAGRHRTPSQDSTVSALSQFLPVCWVSNGREELAGVTLAAPFPLTRGYDRLFFSPSSVPRMVNPDGILQAPMAGAVWRQAQYWC